MRSFHKGAAVIVGCLVLTLAFIAPPSMRGDEWNLATKFTVDHPFQVPGMVLQPNTKYVIRLLDSPSNRNIVQIYDEDQQHMLTMFMGISDERLEPADHTLFTFIETQPGFALPIKEWFYPGRLRGLEFVYPKDQAMEIARHAHEAVLSTASADLHKLNSITVEAIEPIRETSVTASAANITKSENTDVLEEKPVEQPEPEARAAEPLPEAQPEQQAEVQPEAQPEVQPEAQPAPQPEAPAEIAQNEPPAQPQVQREQPEAKDELPATAGELPLIALIGVMCLGAGAGLRVISTRS
jgi:hypothetical protein